MNEDYRNGEMRGVLTPWENSDKGKYVITGPLPGNMNGVIGRLVQVRQKKGVFGTDIVFIREQNNILSTHENQCFWIIPDKYTKELDEKFKDVHVDDSDEEEYTICGKYPVTGFLS